jgi:hypothetical protein
VVSLQVPFLAVNAKGIMDGAGMCWTRIPAQCQSDVWMQLAVKTQGLATMAVAPTVMLPECTLPVEAT